MRLISVKEERRKVFHLVPPLTNTPSMLLPVTLPPLSRFSLMASVLISQGNHLTDIALEEAACASPLRAMEGVVEVVVGGSDGGEEATE